MKRERSTDETRELWEQARKTQDYATADVLREALRAEGFDPDPPRWQPSNKQKVEVLSSSRPAVNVPTALAAMSHRMTLTHPFLGTPSGLSVECPRDTQGKWDMWRQAKANRDFKTADNLRAELRADGVDPDQPKWKSADTEDLLKRWQAAKKIKDYKIADALRTQLRNAGIDPDAVKGSQDRLIQDMLDQWQRAKDAKEWSRADRLRDELRKVGMDPDPRPGACVRDDRELSFTPQMPAAGRAPSVPFSVDRAQLAWSSPYVPEVEAALDEWVKARSEKDWNTADSIRDSLRKSGIEPDKMRPSSVRDLTLEYELQHWQRAKQARDFTRADKIRESLRSKGVDPDRPQGRSCSSNVGYSSGANHLEHSALAALAESSSKTYNSTVTQFDADTEAELDMWWSHKQAKDWVAADALRTQLRQKGIEPEQHRRAS